MPTALHEVLGTQVMLGATQKIAGELPIQHLPESLLRGRCVRAVGSNTGYIIRGEGTNRVARQSQRGSPGRAVTISGSKRTPQVLLHSGNTFNLPFDLLQNLINPRTSQDELISKTEVARQQAEAATLSMNLRTMCVTSAFGLGHIYFDQNGKLLPSSSGAVLDVDYSIPANNQNQLNGIIGASWATTTTKIITDLQQIQKQAIVNSRRPIRHAIYGVDVFDYIYDNAQAQAYLARNPMMQDAFIKGVIPNGFGGIANWYPGDLGFYEDESGTTRTIFSGDKIAFFPDPDPSWYELQEGVEPLPADGFSNAGDFALLLEKCVMANGMFTYAYGTVNPVEGHYVFGDNFLPSIHVPEAVFIADVVP